VLDDYLGHQCAITVNYISDQASMVILGDAFLRNFFTQYDYRDHKVVIGVSTNAPEGTLIDDGQKFTGWQIFGIFIAFTVLIISTIIGSWCFVTRCIVKKYRENKQRAVQSVLEELNQPITTI